MEDMFGKVVWGSSGGVWKTQYAWPIKSELSEETRGGSSSLVMLFVTEEEWEG